MTVTAATIRREVVEPCLDGRAANLEQARLLANRTPEVDCLADVLMPLVKIAPQVAADAFAYLNRILASNQAEGSGWQAVVRTSDALATDLRRLELNDPGHCVMTAYAIARAVREPLRLLVAPSGAAAREYVAAVRAIDDVIDRAPAAVIFAPRVRRELGEKRFALLAELYESRTGLPAPTREAVSS